MSGADRVALDSNAAIAVLNARPGTDAWLRTLTSVYLPVPALGELRFGALGSGRPAPNLARIETLVSQCQILEVRQETTRVYAELRLALKQRGKPIPENDIWIAAICVERNLPLATFDRHFGEVERLKVVLPPIGATR